MDIKALAESLLSTFKSTVLTAVADSAPAIIAAAAGYVTDGEERLKDLAINTINGDLSYDFVVKRLKEEEITLKDALIGIEQMVAADIQALVSSVISQFEFLLKSAILSL